MQLQHEQFNVFVEGFYQVVNRKQISSRDKASIGSSGGDSRCCCRPSSSQWLMGVSSHKTCWKLPRPD